MAVTPKKRARKRYPCTRPLTRHRPPKCSRIDTAGTYVIADLKKAGTKIGEAGTMNHMPSSGQPAPAAYTRDRAGLRIAIIGAGFGGIGLAVLLRRAGYGAITIFERGARVGGTWRDNTYPGAACDVKSHLYSYSFAPNANWSNRFSPQEEILAYIESVADRFDITRLVRLNTGVTTAHYDDARKIWQVTSSAGDTAEFDVVVSAVGQLSQPAIPDFAGLANFAGAKFHAARWDHAVKLAGKRVAIVGAAASAVQIVPELAKIAGHLDVFQRTPNWIIPRNNQAYSGWKKAFFRYVPGNRAWLRYYIYLNQEFLYGAFRTGTWRNRWMKGMAEKHLAAQVPDATTRAALTPTYDVGCKRLLISDDYYPCFSQPDVALVTAGIDHFTQAGIVTADGIVHQADVCVFATGFDVRNCLAPITITGRQGRDMQARWAQGPDAYMGVAVPEFPNFFMMYGPNTNLGHNSIILMLEAQANYITQCLNHLVAGNLASLEVTEPAHARYNTWLQQQLAGTVWTTGCGSWYGQNGKITANWSGSVAEYATKMATPVFADFAANAEA